MEVDGLYEADQGQESKKELAGNQRYESPRYDPSLASRRHRARTADWVDEKADYPGHESQRFEMYGGEVSELSANPKSVVCPPYEMDVLLKKPLPSLPLQRRSSPGLRHPVHERDSLWQKLRGTPASHSYGSSADPCHGDWTVVGVTENATSSQEVSPEDPAPTKDYPLTNAASPSSPKVALASLPSDMSPISPIGEYVHPPLTIASSTTLSRHSSSPGTSEHQEENAGGQTPILSSPLHSMPKEPNNTFFFFDSLDSDIQSLLPEYDSMESSVPMIPQSENIMSQLSLPAVQNRYQPEDMGVPSVSTQPHHLRMYPSDLEGIIPPNGSGNVSEVEKSSSTTQSVVAQVYTPRSENRGFSQIAFSPKYPPRNRRTQPDLQCDNSQSSPEPTRPSSAFHIPPIPGSSNRQTGIATGPIMEVGDFENSDISTQNLEQSDPAQSFSFPNSQPWSSLDHLIATDAIDIDSTDPQWYANEQCPQAAPQNHSCDSGTSQAPFVKWRPYCFDHNSFLVSRLAPKLQQVEDLQDLVRAINAEWMQRMESQPGLWSLCRTLSSSDLFDRAIRTLKNFICGSPAEGFQDVFAIMHLAFAAAFSLTWQQDDYMFSALRDDALQWQRALPRDEDKSRFLNAMDCWRLHELEPPPLFASACHTNSHSMTPQEPLYWGDQQTLRDRLKRGEVFKALIAFVDSKSIISSFKT